MTSVLTGQSGFFAYDPSLGFNDLVNLSQYFYKVEEVVPGKIPTVNCLYIQYRDLGKVTLTFTLTGTDDNQTIVSVSTVVTLGNTVATGRIMTLPSVGLSLTAQNLQLSFLRAAGAGKLAIIKLILKGQVEQ